jgi:para-aminobenzoate synthetase
MYRPQILVVDAYDSFTNNIISLLTTLLDAEVRVLTIDSPFFNPKTNTFYNDLRQELSRYDAVVCGPGPGSPDVDSDVGLMRHIWALQDSDLLPVLGICLGFQSLAKWSGGKIRRLRRGLHGMVRNIEHQKPNVVSGDIFIEVPSFNATLYHSLCVDIGQDGIDESLWIASKWESPPCTPSIVPLAWAYEEGERGTERILMAMKHRTKPFWGLQYHPESVCTHLDGHRVIVNWFQDAMLWNKETGRVVNYDGKAIAAGSTRQSLLSQIKGCQPYPMDAQLENLGMDSRFISRTLPLPRSVSAADIVELLQGKGSEHIILDSSNATTYSGGKADVRGRYSIVAMEVDEAAKIKYRVGDNFVTASLPNPEGKPQIQQLIRLRDGENVWHFLTDFTKNRQLREDQRTQSPFHGGLMGFITYEMGLSGINVPITANRGHQRPDICLAWINKSIVIDHAEGHVHVQHLQSGSNKADTWIYAIAATLERSSIWHHNPWTNSKPPLTIMVNTNSGSKSIQKSLPKSRSGFRQRGPRIKTPDENEYEQQVEKCQEYIAAGESYELCLTDQTTITQRQKLLSITESIQVPSLIDGAQLKSQNSKQSGCASAWQLYRKLRCRQPAPFGSFIRVGGATLISSSPERFLEYNTTGLCSMRPMKGTVRKSETVAILDQAERILHVPKEEAENLMIVDLVRHDLNGVCGPGNVTVPHLMKVEEYATVFQMITIVDGQLPKTTPSREDEAYTGFDVLAACLPPGSMTGAPKKRSCELLQEIEGHQERSLYSGVVGYMDVTGKGDWSVTIRSMFHWDDEVAAPEMGDTSPREVWHIGAGGAVTILSTPEGEREEMFTKLSGPLSVFTEMG